MNTYDTAGENDLAQRLHRLGETTEFDVDAWDKIVERGEGHSTNIGRRVLIGVAAGSLVVGGVVVALDRDGERLETTDDGTLPADSTVDTTSSTTASTTSSTTTSTDATVPGLGAGPEPDAPQTTTTTEFTGDGAPPTPPTRKPAVMTLALSDYTVEVVLSGRVMYLRRTDDVGSVAVGMPESEEPDYYGFLDISAWGDPQGPQCLTSGGGAFTFPGVATHSFTYGLVGSGIARVEIVLADGARVDAPIGPAVPFGGFRAWLIERPNGEIDRVEGFDQQGALVSTSTRTSGGGDDFGYALPSCPGISGG